MPSAPPAGSVFATDVLVCVITADGHRRSPISPAWFAIQYVQRLKIMTAISDQNSNGVRVRIDAQIAL